MILASPLLFFANVNWGLNFGYVGF